VGGAALDEWNEDWCRRVEGTLRGWRAHEGHERRTDGTGRCCQSYECRVGGRRARARADGGRRDGALLGSKRRQVRRQCGCRRRVQSGATWRGKGSVRRGARGRCDGSRNDLHSGNMRGSGSAEGKSENVRRAHETDSP